MVVAPRLKQRRGLAPARMTRAAGGGLLACCLAGQLLAASAPTPLRTMPAKDVQEHQVTRGPGQRILTNTGVWSPDGEWIVYDTRSDPPVGDGFDGPRIELVHVRTGEVKPVYASRNGAFCGVATFNPREPKVVFILGPEHPAPDWQYGFSRRQGVIVDTRRPGIGVNLDACDLVPPFTAGALRGGSHVHVWDAAGDWVSFTYEDQVLTAIGEETEAHEINLRTIGVSVPGRPVEVPRTHPRNHDGSHWTVVGARTTANARPGSDEIKKAFEEGWVGERGYLKPDGSRQRRALAFQGHVVTAKGETISEVFLADLPEDLTQVGEGPLAGTATRRPRPPQGVTQRRLTFTADRKFPGLQGPRHWLRSSPDGARIAFLMKDDDGIVQLWTVSPNGGAPHQITRNAWSVASTFTWSPDGRFLTYVMDRSVCVTEVASGVTTRLTPATEPDQAPKSEACVFSPDGRRIAFMRRVPSAGVSYNQICVVDWKPPAGH